MTKIKGVTGVTYDAQTLKNPANGKVYLNGTKFENKATGESYVISDTEEETVEYIYAKNRADDWMPMVEPEDNEIYMLFNVYEDNGFISFFSVGSSYKVEVGKVEKGKFVADDSMTQELTTGSVYRKKFNHEDFDYEISDGAKQIMIKVSGEKISIFEFFKHNDFMKSTFVGWDVVEFWCNLPDVEYLHISKSESSPINMMKRLEFVKVTNTSKITQMMLCYMPSLKMILDLKMNPDLTKRKFTYFCYNCPSLIYVPPVGANGNCDYCFSNTKLRRIELENFENATAAYLAFQNNPFLEEIVGFNTKSVASNMLLQKLYKLKEIEIDMSSMNSTTLDMSDMCSLKRLKFKSTTGNAPKTINISNAGLEKDALMEALDSLPYIESAKTVKITGCMGAEQLTDTDIAEITVKGWSVTK